VVAQLPRGHSAAVLRFLARRLVMFPLLLLVIYGSAVLLIMRLMFAASDKAAFIFEQRHYNIGPARLIL
jgi:hypothetical protein